MAITTNSLKAEKLEKAERNDNPIITESLKPIDGSKNWVIILRNTATYTHPSSKKVFTKGVAVYTSNEDLANDCKNNSYFSVQEA